VLKKILIGGLIACVVLFAGVFFWAKSVLTGDAVRSTLAAQVGKAIGQPVTIGSIDATIMPRVSVTLGDVKIGPPNKLTVGNLQVGTDFRALLSRRIEHASLRLTGARIELPLPAFIIPESSAPAEAETSAPAVELVSIDEIVMSDVEVVSGGRTLRGDIEIVPQGKGLVIRRIALGADKTAIDITGQITDFNGPVGDISVTAGALDMDQLLAFVNDFTSGAGLAESAPAVEAPASGTAPSASAPPAGMKVTLSVQAESATMGGLTLDKLNGKARIQGNELALDPVSFGIFGGRYEGSLALTPGQTLRFKGRSKLSNVDVAAATAFAGSPNTVTGRLSGSLDFSGSGSDPAVVMKTVAGKARIDIVDGVVKNLGLVNNVVQATSMRTGALSQAASTAKSGPSDEPFSKLGATFEIARGAVSTSDMVFLSKDLTLTAQGIVNLVASTLDLKGRVQLSPELTAQAGSDLVKYTQEEGRVTLPATISGTFEAPSVRIDAGDMAKRALRNAVNEQKDKAKAEATKAATKKLGGLFGR
jgi:uncharacterized protein involved in outer membrane biogenesis